MSFRAKIDFNKSGIYKILNDKTGKPVLQINTASGVVINEYRSCSEAERATNIKGIRQCAVGKRKTAGGFIWKYK